MTISTVTAPAQPRLVDDTGASSSDDITGNAMPQFSGTAEVDALITLYDTDGITVLGSAVVDPSGTWRITPVTPLSDGAHQLSITETGSDNVESVPSQLLVITVDTAAPGAPGAPVLAAGNDSGASASDGITRVSLPTVTGSAEAGSAVTLFSSDGQTTLGYGVADAHGVYTIDLQSAIGEGSNFLLVQATDIAGNVSAMSAPGAAIFVDSIAPDMPTGLALDAASDSGVTGDSVTSARSVLINGHAEAGATVTLMEGYNLASLGTATADAQGNWQIRSDILSLGDHFLDVSATDLAGNVSTISDSLALTIVSPVPPSAPTAPLLTAGSDSGASGDGVSNVNRPVVTGQGIADALVTLYDSDGTTVLGTTVADAEGAWSIISTVALADGAHTLTAKQTDPVGGGVSSASTALRLTIDTAAPTGLQLSNHNVAVNIGANGVVGQLHASDAGAVTYALVEGSGDDDNAAFAISGNVLHVIDAAALGIGTESLRIRVTDTAGNITEQSMTVSITAAQTTPPADSGDPDAPSTIDGVPVTSSPVTLPGGGDGIMVGIPVVTSIADGGEMATIPLAGGTGGALLTAQVPVGMGLSATAGDSTTAAASSDHLIAAIVATSHDTSDQAQLSGGGQQFLGRLPVDVPLLLSTVVLHNAAGAIDPALTLTGTSSASQHTALVVDASQMTAAGQVVLEHVDFAAVVGALAIRGDTAGQMLTGDGAAQHFSVSGSGSVVAAGGGDDVLAYAGAAAEQANQLAAGAAATPAAIVFDGGTGSDTAVFAKAQADYTVSRYDGHVVVADDADPSQQIVLSNVETLRFSDGSEALQSRAELGTLAGMYQSVLGRQADISGFEFWGQAQGSGAESLGRIAVDLIGSGEGAARGYALTGDAAHDVGVLYQALFGRAADAGGAAFWVQSMQQGHSLAEVAQHFVTSAEIVGHQLAATSWNLHF